MKTPLPLFFSGGTALRGLSRELAAKSIKSVHIISTFDSGGSSAAIRKSFSMPAVGDIRNRLLALADTNKCPQAVLDFCNYRLNSDDLATANAELAEIGDPGHDIWQIMPEDYAKILWHNLNHFSQLKPANFDARNASLGNLLLTGAYLEHKRDFGPALALYGSLFRIKGSVLPIANTNVHLGAVLENGNVVIGQHFFAHLESPVQKLFLTVHEPEGEAVELTECHPPMLTDVKVWTGIADVICFPMGSFYSSILANLLPKGVGQAVAMSAATKVFIPNSGNDSELCGMTVPEQARRILACLKADAAEATNAALLNHVLVDTENGRYPGGFDSHAERQLMDMGLNVVKRRIVNPDNPQTHDPALTLQAILELCA